MMLGSLVPSSTIDLAHRPQRTSSLPQTSSTPQDATVPPVTRTAVALEYASLRYQEHCPLGMYVVPTAESIMIWEAVLFVHQGMAVSILRALPAIMCLHAGYYADSVLKFRLTFPTNYPERPPVVQFMTDVFHPLISQKSGVFNLAPRFRPWR